MKLVATFEVMFQALAIGDDKTRFVVDDEPALEQRLYTSRDAFAAGADQFREKSHGNFHVDGHAIGMEGRVILRKLPKFGGDALVQAHEAR